MISLPQPAKTPTMYFVGVTTQQSSIMQIFPKWAAVLGIQAVLKGIDIPIHAPAEDYRAVVNFIKQDPLSLGALVTTHKIDMYQAAKDIFDECDPLALSFGELSSISKMDGKLWAKAKDPISSGSALSEFIPEGYWEKTGAAACVLGSGGSALSIAWNLAKDTHGNDVPQRIFLTNRSSPRLEKAVRILTDVKVPVHYCLCPDPKLNDAIVESLPEGSVIVNATGLGKDRPGSPLTDHCQFPRSSRIWEINYRGSLEFLHQAELQKAEKALFIEDGWPYFIYGWTQVVGDVFHMDITGDLFKACDKIARDMRK